MIILQGWTNPLPPYIIEAIKVGKIVVKQGRFRDEDYDYLVGETTTPDGKSVVVFADGKRVEKATQNIFMLREIARLTTV